MIRRVGWAKGKRGKGPSGRIKIRTPWPFISVEMVGDECHITPGGTLLGQGRSGKITVPLEIGTDWEVEERPDRWVLKEVVR